MGKAKCRLRAGLTSIDKYDNKMEVTIFLDIRFHLAGFSLSIFGRKYIFLIFPLLFVLLFAFEYQLKLFLFFIVHHSFNVNCFIFHYVFHVSLYFSFFTVHNYFFYYSYLHTNVFITYSLFGIRESMYATSVLNVRVCTLNSNLILLKYIK